MRVNVDPTAPIREAAARIGAQRLDLLKAAQDALNNVSNLEPGDDPMEDMGHAVLALVTLAKEDYMTIDEFNHVMSLVVDY